MINQNTYTKIKENWDGLLKPLDALGEFEEISAKIGAILDDEGIYLKPALLVYCADNGIIAQGVSQSDESVTANVAMLLGNGSSSVCHMAHFADIDIFPVNLGIKLTERIAGVDNSFYIAPGTKDFSKEAAMSLEQCQAAIEAGRRYVRALYNKGYQCFLLGEMGIGNTTTSAAVISALLKLSAKDVCSRGAGLSDEGLNRKIQVIDNAIVKYGLTDAPAMDVLRTVGGFDIAAMVGSILEARDLSIPVILDGVITCAAALIAERINPEIKDVIFFSHKGRENGIMLVADYFGVHPVLDGNLALGEGTGAVMFIQVLKTALSVYDGGTTFEDASIEAYRRFS